MVTEYGGKKKYDVSLYRPTSFLIGNTSVKIEATILLLNFQICNNSKAFIDF